MTTATGAPDIIRYCLNSVTLDLENDPQMYINLFSVLKDFADQNINYEEARIRFESIIYEGKPVDILNGILEETNRKTPFPSKVKDSKKMIWNWNEYEDKRLLAAIFIYGTSDWIIISKFVGLGPTNLQCSQRWERSLNPKVKKEYWTEDEDAKLLLLVDKNPIWKCVSAGMGNRSDVQCRYRYKQLLKTNYKKGYEIYPIKGMNGKNYVGRSFSLEASQQNQAQKAPKKEDVEQKTDNSAPFVCPKRYMINPKTGYPDEMVPLDIFLNMLKKD